MKNRGTSPKHFQLVVSVLFSLLVVSNGGYTHLLASAETSPITIRVGNAPNGIAFDPLNGNLYVANFETGTVSVINGTTNSVIATVKLGPDLLGKLLSIRPMATYTSQILTMARFRSLTDQIIPSLLLRK